MKYIKRILLLLVLATLISGCDDPGTNYEIELHETKDGLVRYRSNNALFTGKYYISTCEECSEPLLNNWPVHSAGYYKDGKKDGVFWFPKSGRSDDFFQYSDRKNQTTIVYKNGEIVDADP